MIEIDKIWLFPVDSPARIHGRGNEQSSSLTCSLFVSNRVKRTINFSRITVKLRQVEGIENDTVGYN